MPLRRAGRRLIFGEAMNVRIHPKKLRGRVRAIPSKSDAHRLLILSALADAQTLVRCASTSRDIDATAAALNALGASVKRTDGGFLVEPAAPVAQDAVLDCGESGSTLRFLLPVAAALGARVRFVGSERLGERPIAPLVEALRSGGVSVSAERLPVEVSGRLRAGEYSISGDVSSQFVSGMLMALAALGGGAVRLTTPLESAGYVEMTRRSLGRFGVNVSFSGGKYSVSGALISPHEVAAEGDWSSAAFWLEANALGAGVAVEGLDDDSAQPDRAMRGLLERLGGTVDVSGSPDLFPALAFAATAAEDETRFVGGRRLRFKESDRIAATAAALRAMGGVCRETGDGLIVAPSRLVGGTVDGANDHRIVMAAAVAATAAGSVTTILGADAASKSYPSFFDDFRSLGGALDVI